jgi:hypothetical protein
MRAAKIARIGLVLGVGGLVALSVWMRLSSLESLPDIDGDEAWYGVQAGRFLRGQPYTIWTPHVHPTNPFHTVLVGLLLLVSEPRLWLLRVPCLLGGLAAIPVTYRLMGRALDRTTGLIAAVLMAILPVSIVWSRTGYDGSQLLLFSMLILAAALAAHRGAIALMTPVCLLAHPMAIFLAPTLAAVYGVRSGAFDASVPRPQRLRRVAAAGAAVAGAIVFGIFVLLLPDVQRLMGIYRLGYVNQHDWREFWGWFGRLFLVVGREPRPHTDRTFWIVVLPVLILGSWRLAANRRWDRLALVVGVILSATGMALVGGTTILQPGMTRYGLPLVPPAAVAFACLLRELLDGVPGAAIDRGRAIKMTALVGLGWAVLLSLRMEELNGHHVRDAKPAPGHDTIWSWGDPERNPSKRALRRILADIAADPGDRWPRALIVDDWNTYMTLSYLALDRPRVEVVFLNELGKQPDFPARFRSLLEGGGYGIGPPGSGIEIVSNNAFGPQALDRWIVPRYGQPLIQILHLRPPATVAGREPEAAVR